MLSSVRGIAEAGLMLSRALAIRLAFSRLRMREVTPWASDDESSHRMP